MSTNQLHKSKLPAFKSWLDSKGILWRDTTASYQVIQVQLGTKPKFWASVYQRDNSTEHYTVDSRMDRMLWQFIKESKQ